VCKHTPLTAMMIMLPVPLTAWAGPKGALPSEFIDKAAKPFPLSRVRLLDGPFRAAQEVNRRYLHALDAERMLHNFRINAGFGSEAEPLGGWEAPTIEVRGHFVAHYLSACALMYASTGDEPLKKKAGYSAPRILATAC